MDTLYDYAYTKLTKLFNEQRKEETIKETKNILSLWI